MLTEELNFLPQGTQHKPLPPILQWHVLFLAGAPIINLSPTSEQPTEDSVMQANVVVSAKVTASSFLLVPLGVIEVPAVNG